MCCVCVCGGGLEGVLYRKERKLKRWSLRSWFFFLVIPKERGPRWYCQRFQLRIDERREKEEGRSIGGAKSGNNPPLMFKSHEVIIHLYKKRQRNKDKQGESLLLHNSSTREKQLCFLRPGARQLHGKALGSSLRNAVSSFNKCVETSWKSFW